MLISRTNERTLYIRYLLPFRIAFQHGMEISWPSRASQPSSWHWIMANLGKLTLSNSYSAWREWGLSYPKGEAGMLLLLLLFYYYSSVQAKILSPLHYSQEKKITERNEWPNHICLWLTKIFMRGFERINLNFLIDSGDNGKQSKLQKKPNKLTELTLLSHELFYEGKGNFVSVPKYPFWVYIGKRLHLHELMRSKCWKRYTVDEQEWLEVK